MLVSNFHEILEMRQVFSEFLRKENGQQRLSFERKEWEKKSYNNGANANGNDNSDNNAELDVKCQL